MPTYDYHCTTNNAVVEVHHGMSERLETWGDLCEKAGIEPGHTPLESPVQKLITGGQVVNSRALKNPEPACGTGCASGMCQYQ